MRIIIAAGGTGGHIYPGIALAEELKLKDDKNEILFIGSKDGLEKNLVNFPIKLINARGLLRKLSWKALSAPFVTLCGFFEALGIIFRFRPDWIVAMGGYVALPVVFAARICSVPVLLHEQNVLPGITNRICSRIAKIVTLSFSESLKYIKGIVTGNPVRRQILAVSHRESKRFSVLIVGGSQGSRTLNYAVIAMLDKFVDSGVDIIHVCGERDYPELPKKEYPFYKLISYMYNIEEGLSQADLVVSRAGATAISEILAAGRPSVLIPFPYSSEGHQELNAMAVVVCGAALILHDQEIDKLAAMIKELASDKERLIRMKKAALDHSFIDSASRIVKLLYEKN
ncbi:MAG: undecaprenyldiphospho-muramoylpentapeptide beta-N-acetylglucosaminyltransferase [Candidatus Saganbacteria bacterium]|nr:undecaprenyldiphospho-muramoylpentapeptide beta-N-acetylglucosaminyltransferase [Candidatus Saganbacteria bacterium]